MILNYSEIEKSTIKIVYFHFQTPVIEILIKFEKIESKLVRFKNPNTSFTNTRYLAAPEIAFHFSSKIKTTFRTT